MDDIVFASCNVPPRYRDVQAERLQHRDEIEAYCQRAAEGANEGRGLWLAGPLGTGKSRGLAYIAARSYELAQARLIPRVGMAHGERVEWQERGHCSAMYAPCWQIATSLRQRGWGEDDDSLYLGTLRTCNLLCLDEVGGHYEAPWISSWFSETIEARYGAGLATCVGTNLLPPQFAQLSEWARAADRLKEICYVLPFTGPSQRKAPHTGDLFERGDGPTD